jgi:hypothetical protein
MLDLRRVIHRKIPSEIREASPASKPAIMDARAKPPEIPEYQVSLPGDRAASPEDLSFPARSLEGSTVPTAEVKCLEPPGPRASIRYTNPTAGKITRIRPRLDAVSFSAKRRM